MEGLFALSLVWINVYIYIYEGIVVLCLGRICFFSSVGLRGEIAQFAGIAQPVRAGRALRVPIPFCR